MKPNPSRRRFVLICAALVLVCVGLVAGTVYKRLRQQQLDNVLITAIHRLDPDAVKTALGQGANPNARDNVGAPLTFWQMLTVWLHSRARTLLSGNPALSLVLSPETQIIYGKGRRVVSHDPRIVQALLEAGANPDTPDKNGSPPLVVACTGCPPEDVRLLLAHHARIEARDRYGRTGLIYAATSEEYSVVPLLLEHGAEVNARDMGGETALMMAAMMGRVPTANRMLEHHADITAADLAGNTALSYAKRYNHTNMIRLLQQHGAKK